MEVQNHADKLVSSAADRLVVKKSMVFTYVEQQIHRTLYRTHYLSYVWKPIRLHDLANRQIAAEIRNKLVKVLEHTESVEVVDSLLCCLEG